MPADAAAPRVDAHHHFWRYADGLCAWMADAPAILHRDYLPADLAPALKAAGIDGTVIVQAAETPVETDWLLALARDVPWVWGVVGWLDPADAGAVARAEAWRATGRLSGIRLWYQDDADGERLRAVVGAPLLAWAAAHDMPIDLLIRPRHLSAAVALVDASPDLRFVVDHGAKPDIARWAPDAEERLQWWDAMDRLARHHRVCCKLSGLVTEAAPDDAPDSLKPYVDALLQLFGPARLLWGSDWPVALSARGYADWAADASRLLGHLSAPERDAIFGTNAIRFYRLTP